MSVNNMLKKTQNPTSASRLITYTLPILNDCKNHFLKYIGYWPQIYNGFNQAAFVEFLNGDKKKAIILLLKSTHFHPNLSETYKALSNYLKILDKKEGAHWCDMFSKSLLKADDISLETREKCLQAAIDITKK